MIHVSKAKGGVSGARQGGPVKKKEKVPNAHIYKPPLPQSHQRVAAAAAEDAEQTNTPAAPIERCALPPHIFVNERTPKPLTRFPGPPVARAFVCAWHDLIEKALAGTVDKSISEILSHIPSGSSVNIRCQREGNCLGVPVGTDVQALVISMDDKHGLLLYPPHPLGTLFTPSRFATYLTMAAKWKQSLRLAMKNPEGSEEAVQFRSFDWLTNHGHTEAHKEALAAAAAAEAAEEAAEEDNDEPPPSEITNCGVDLARSVATAAHRPRNARLPQQPPPARHRGPAGGGGGVGCGRSAIVVQTVRRRRGRGECYRGGRRRGGGGGRGGRGAWR